MILMILETNNGGTLTDGTLVEDYTSRFDGSTAAKAGKAAGTTARTGNAADMTTSPGIAAGMTSSTRNDGHSPHMATGRNIIPKLPKHKHQSSYLCLWIICWNTSQWLQQKRFIAPTMDRHWLWITTIQTPIRPQLHPSAQADAEYQHPLDATHKSSSTTIPLPL